MDFRSLIDIPVHPAADVFPMLDAESLTALDNNIRANGQAVPIVLWDGRLVDGRNRYVACVRAGIKPKTKSVTFADDAECIRFIISTNIHRRHLSESQRAMIAKELATLSIGRPSETPSKEGVSQAEAARLMNVSVASVERASTVAKSAPDLAAKVKSGELKVSRAAAIARERTKPKTDPDQAADSVVDDIERRHASGDTPRMRKVWAAYSALDATEQTQFRLLLESK